MNDYTFKPGPVPSLATVVLFPLFVFLGLWQLHRAEQREELIALRTARSEAREWALTATDFPALEQVRYRRILAAGEYDAEHQILLDNQIVDHRAGYFVLTPLKLRPGGEAILVNRGWVPAGPDRARLPEVPVTANPRLARGTVDRFPAVGWRIEGAETPTAGWPAVVQVLDQATLSRHLGYPVLPYQVLLGASEPEGYLRRWQAADPDPGKNRGYALQWFSFAAILIVLFLWFGFKPKSPAPR